MGKNIQRLGDTLHGRMTKTSAAAVRTTIELGTIGDNLSLITDSLRSSIPRGQYMIDITLNSPTYRTSIESHTHEGGEHDPHGGTHTHDGGEHDHRLPERFRSIQPGDRVLVAWCGHEPVVFAIVEGS